MEQFLRPQRRNGPFDQRHQVDLFKRIGMAARKTEQATGDPSAAVAFVNDRLQIGALFFVIRQLFEQCMIERATGERGRELPRIDARENRPHAGVKLDPRLTGSILRSRGFKTA